MSSCAVALSNSPVFSPSSQSSSSTAPHLAWLHKPRGRIRASGHGESSALKRKRPARLDIPVVLGAEKVVAQKADVPEMTEVEGEGYSVCCKRGRKEVMEDRYSALLRLQGDQNQVYINS